MDRGFEIMIPRGNKKPEPKPDFDYGISFSLFGKTYKLGLQVIQQRRTR